MSDVSKREFFNTSYWKQKRYNNVIFQPGKNPADFELVELEDIQGYEHQQFIGNLISNGFMSDGFKIVEGSPASTTAVRITQGRGWLQAGEPSTGGLEFSGIRLDLPDVLTNFPTLTYEHAVTGGYYGMTITAPNPTGTRYDLIFVKFSRQIYTASGRYFNGILQSANGDPEITEASLGETAVREKWYYEFVYQQGDAVNTNPNISGLAPKEHGVRLAVIVRQDGNNITNSTIIDVRPKFSSSSNLIGTNTVTVGPVGANYTNLYDVVSNLTGTNPITPSITNPYKIKLFAGIQTCPRVLNFGSMGYIKIEGEGADKTIIEFDDIYSLSPVGWVTVSGSPFIEFSNLTLRIKSTQTLNAWLMNISNSTVYFNNCKIGDFVTPNTTILGGGIIASGTSTLNMINCEMMSRSTSKAALDLEGSTTARIIHTRIKQSGYQTITNNTNLNGFLRLESDTIQGNKTLLYLNGISSISEADLIKSQWNTGDVTTTDNLIQILAPTTINNINSTFTTGQGFILVQYDSDFYNLSHYDTITINSAIPYSPRFVGCSLSNVVIANGNIPEFVSCEFVASASTSVVVTGGSPARFMGCFFSRDGLNIDSTSSEIIVKGCRFYVTNTGATYPFHIVEIKGNSLANFEECRFRFSGANTNNSGVVAIYSTVNTAIPHVIGCSFVGDNSGWLALGVDAAVAGTVCEVAYISSKLAGYKGANVSLISLENLSGSSFPPGFINGLRVSYTTANQVTIATGNCRDDGNVINLSPAAPIIVDITTPGLNGLDTAPGTPEAPNTWYYIWLVYNPTTFIYGGLLSTSPTTPLFTHPSLSGFTRKRRVGSVRNDNSSNFVQFKMSNTSGGFRIISLYSPTSVFSSALTAGVGVAVSLTTAVPPISSYVNVRATITVNNRRLELKDNDAPATPNFQISTDLGSAPGYVNGWLTTDASNQVTITGIGGNINAGQADLSVLGYREDL